MKKKIQNSIRRLLAVITAFVMACTVIGMNAVPVMAEGSGTITITPPSGVEKAQDYKIYKVFQGTGNGSGISYKLLNGHTTLEEAWTNSGMGTYFTVDAVGNVSAVSGAYTEDATTHKRSLTGDAVTAIGKYVTAIYNLNSQTPTEPTYTATKTSGATNYTASNVDDGYYYITTTTGTVVTIDSANHNATVQDKNTVPSVDKLITYAPYADNNTDIQTGSLDSNGNSGKNAIAEIGSTIQFGSTITVGAGAKNYVYHDKMGAGLKLDNTVTVSAFTPFTGGDEENEPTRNSIGFVQNTDYVIDTNPSDGDTFDIRFMQAGLSKLQAGYTIEIQYYATVTSDALRDSTDNPGNRNGTNTAKVTYGDKNDTTQESTTKVYNAVISLTKTFENVTSNYPVAGFVLRRGNGQFGNPYEYYKYNEATSSKPASISWVKLGDDENGVVDDATLKAALGRQITELKTTSENNVLNFAGLANGTYTLVESTVPDGYNKANTVEITINNANSKDAFTKANLEKSVTIENKPGSLLPSTGGIGTTIFYIAGGVIIACAILLLVMRHKKDE